MRDKSSYERALRLIPWATQTNAKRPKPIIEETMPLFVTRAKGTRMFDQSGDEHTDYLCALGPIILGYAYDPVDKAVKRQIEAGVLFSVASTIEYELAEQLTNLFPSLEWVRFLKTGGDATSAAVRLARAYKGKTKIMRCGYHGWHDWCQVSSTGNSIRGIPEVLSPLTIEFEFNDIRSVETILAEDDDIAGIILTPYDWYHEPTNGFLQRLRKLCDQYDVPLIFDEVLTGFRLGLLGAQGRYSIKPDLSIFAKAIANGYPLAVIGGDCRFASILNEDRTIITSTYAGETVSIAAAIQTIRELKERNVYQHIYSVGNLLREGLVSIAKDSDLPIVVTGQAALQKLFVDTGKKTTDRDTMYKISREYMRHKLFIKEHDGVSYYLNYSHSASDIDRVLEVTRKIFRDLQIG